jgi:ABC-2 type transport system ATP-binding protein
VLDQWRKIEGVHSVLSENEHVSILVGDSNAILPQVFEAATAQGVRITSVEIQEPNLETVFLHLTGRGLRD